LLRDADSAREMGQRGREHVLKYLLPEDTYLKRLVEIWGQTATGERLGNL
jgi:hypothetical protein